MELNILKVSVPVLMMMFQTGNCFSEDTIRWMLEQLRGPVQPAMRSVGPESGNVLSQPVSDQERVRQRAEIQARIEDLSNLGGNPEILRSFSDGIRNWEEKPQYEAALNRANAEIARLRREAGLRRQQEEARARQEAEQLQQEEEAREKREAELLRQQEEERAKQAEEVQQRMWDLENLGGNSAILNKFANGTRSPEEIIKYRAALNRADAEIARLRREAELKAQYK